MTTSPTSELPKHQPTTKRDWNALRWLSLPLVAWLANYLGYLLGGTLGMLATKAGLLNPPSDDSVLNRSLRYAIWMVPAGVLCIVAAAATVPRWRRTTAVIVAVWWTLCHDFIHSFESPTLWVTVVASAIGLAIVFGWQHRWR